MRSENYDHHLVGFIMDEPWTTREIVEEACRFDDEVRAICERDEEKRSQVEKQQDGDLVFKRYEAPQQQIRDLSTEEQKRWDDWFDRRFKAALWPQLERFAELMGENVTDRQNELILQLREKFSEMRTEIAGLRADIEILRAHKAVKADLSLTGSVTPLLRGRDVA
jgi:hypothetical protein